MPIFCDSLYNRTGEDTNRQPKEDCRRRKDLDMRSEGFYITGDFVPEKTGIKKEGDRRKIMLWRGKNKTGRKPVLFLVKQIFESCY